jgi:hypothetical protein
MVIDEPVSSTSVKTITDEVHDAPRDTSISHRTNVIMMRFIIYVLLAQIRRLKGEVSQLKEQRKMQSLRKQNSSAQKISCDNILLSDEDVQFYTGLQSKSVFYQLLKFTSKFVNRRWKGLKCLSSKIKKVGKTKRFGPQRKLLDKDEFLLTLMRLKLGLVQKHLSGLFGISITLVSQIFNAWLAALDQTATKCLLFWPNKEQIHTTTPQRFRTVRSLRAIIDCSELFIETPKDPKLQAVTWSDYKHHNTAKFLVACAPNSMITFISSIYGGRASDKSITNDSCFLDLCDEHDVVMADKGFNIRDECISRHIVLEIPPGKKGEAQMTIANVQKTKMIAKLRILIEQVIRRMKTFRILKFEIPISMLPNLDKIVRVCGALCNLKEPIYKT